MSVAAASQQAPRPCAAFRPAAQRQQARRPRAALAAPVRASMTSGVEVQGMRPTSPKAWEMISTTLKKSGVTFVTPAQAAAAAAKGTPVIDVRPYAEYKKGHIPGATSCSYFQAISGWDPASIVRRIGFTAFGVYGTEANPTFVEEVAAACPRKNGLIIVCNIGGSLTPTGPSEFGRQSRSLTSAYELVQAGFKGIKVLDGGQNAWNKEERDVELE